MTNISYTSNSLFNDFVYSARFSGALFTLSVTIPPSQNRDQELAFAEYAILAAARQARAAGGQVTSGTVLMSALTQPNQAAPLATYAYAPLAAS